jgi:hypothetical protein
METKPPELTALGLLKHWALYRDDVTRPPKIFCTTLKGGFDCIKLCDRNPLLGMFGEQGEIAWRVTVNKLTAQVRKHDFVALRTADGRRWRIASVFEAKARRKAFIVDSRTFHVRLLIDKLTL